MKENLIICQNGSNSPHNFLDIGLVPVLCNTTGKLSAPEMPPGYKAYSKVYATELTRHLPSTELDKCTSLLEFVSNEFMNPISIPGTSEQFMGKYDIIEDVSDINGVCIPAYYEFGINGSAAAWPEYTSETAPELSRALKMTVKYMANLEGANYRLEQIKKFEWLDELSRDECVERLHLFVDYINPELEVSMNVEFMGITILGRIDIVAADRVIEIKTCAELSPEAQIQIAIYAFMYETKWPGCQRYQLYNLKTGELLELKVNYIALKELIRILICNKYHSKIKDDTDNNDEFLAAIAGIAVVNQCAECALWS